MGRLIMDIEVFNKNYLPAINNIESMTNEKLVDTVPVILEKQFTVLEQTKNKVAQGMRVNTLQAYFRKEQRLNRFKML